MTIDDHGPVVRSLKVAVMGMGACGEATAAAIESVRAGVEILKFDPPKRIVSDVSQAKFAFICVSAPTANSGYVDVSAIRECLEYLSPNTVVAIRSTVIPGVTVELQEKFPKLILFFVPEFLTEATRFEDAKTPTRVIIGSPLLCEDDGGVEVQPRHRLRANLRALLPSAPTLFMSSNSAEFAKYTANSFYALKVVYFNQLYALAGKLGVEWDDIRAAVKADPWIGDQHTDVHHGNGRGFDGKCLPKDVAALLALAKRNSAPMSILEAAVDANALLLRDRHKTSRAGP